MHWNSCNRTRIYLLEVDNRNTRARCEICSKLAIKTLEQRHWRLSGVFIVNFEHISHLVLVFLLLTLNTQSPAWNWEYFFNNWGVLIQGSAFLLAHPQIPKYPQSFFQPFTMQKQISAKLRKIILLRKQMPS